VVLLALLIGGTWPAGSLQAAPGRQGAATIRAQELTLRGPDFAAGQSKGPLQKDAGLILTLPATAVYTSPVILAPLPFSDLGCVWQAALPAGTSLLLEVRTSPEPEGKRWSPWTRIAEEDDLPSPAFGEHAGKLLSIPQRDGVHRRLQYRFLFSALSDGALPQVQRLTFTFIDARAGPTTKEIMARQGPHGTIKSVDRPPVISREEWGCPEGPYSPRWPPEYQRVTHVIIHHTATPNDDTDWAARVRAIWYYHANTRGWGDIAYNFLIDPLGNVYEGRAGGDDVIGGHALNYNPGTMGIGNLGTYDFAPVQPPMQDTMEQLIAGRPPSAALTPWVPLSTTTRSITTSPATAMSARRPARATCSTACSPPSARTWLPASASRKKRSPWTKATPASSAATPIGTMAARRTAIPSGRIP